MTDASGATVSGAVHAVLAFFFDDGLLHMSCTVRSQNLGRRNLTDTDALPEVVRLRVQWHLGLLPNLGCTWIKRDTFCELVKQEGNMNRRLVLIIGIWHTHGMEALWNVKCCDTPL